jgi:PAS domain S-box-containing protein
MTEMDDCEQSKNKPVRDANKLSVLSSHTAHAETGLPLDADSIGRDEQHFRTLAEASFEGIALTERGMVVDCNDQLAELLGYTRSELIGKSVVDLVAPQSRAFVEEAHRTGMQGPYEHIALRKDGTILTVEVRARFLNSRNRELRVAAIRDISEQKKSEEALENDRNLLRTLIDNLPDLIYFKDADGRYVLNNLAHLHSMGVARQEDVLGKTTFDFHPLELAQQYHDDERKIVATGNALPGREELAFHKDTGEQRWHLTTKIPIKNSQGTVTGFVGISRDITDQKRLEQQRDHYVQELQEALDRVTTLSGLLPICSGCKKIRNDQGYWQQVEGYIMEHTSARFTHGLCPECLSRLYPDFKR